MKKFTSILTLSVLGLTCARADVVTDATAIISGFAAPVGLGAAAILAVAAVFVGIKVAKRIFGKL